MSVTVWLTCDVTTHIAWLKDSYLPTKASTCSLDTPVVVAVNSKTSSMASRTLHVSSPKSSADLLVHTRSDFGRGWGWVRPCRSARADSKASAGGLRSELSLPDTVSPVQIDIAAVVTALGAHRGQLKHTHQVRALTPLSLSAQW